MTSIQQEKPDLENSGPQEHPIVERPNIDGIRKWHGYNYQWGQKEMEWMADFIEHLEAQLTFDQERNMDLHKCQAMNRTLLNEVHQAKAIIEGLTAERDRAEDQLKEADLATYPGH